MLGSAIGSAAALASRKVDVEAELCGNHNLVADWLKRFAHQFLVRERAIGFSRIEMGDAKIMSRTNQPDHLALVGCWSIARAHTHAAETESRDFESAFSQDALLH